ncbi:MAG: pilin [Candidatus Paceibacteria bacterium]
MTKKIINTIILSSFVLSPALVLAANPFLDVLGNFEAWIGDTILIVIGLAIAFFFWGLAKYILNAGDEEKKKEGRSIMIWGIIALFVMVSVWGIVRLLAETFGVRPDANLKVPSITIPPVKP